MSEIKNEKIIDEKDLSQKLESIPTGEGNSVEKSEGISSSSSVQSAPVSQTPTIQIPVIPNVQSNQNVQIDPSIATIFPLKSANWGPEQKAIFLATFAIKFVSQNKNMEAKKINEFVRLMSSARALFQSSKSSV